MVNPRAVRGRPVTAAAPRGDDADAGGQYSIRRPRHASSDQSSPIARPVRRDRAYIDHPLGERDDFHLHTQNMENAGKWYRWVTLQTPLVCIMPWWVNQVFVPEQDHQPRLLADQLDIITHCCSLLIQCGGFVSPHMAEHERHARRAGISVAQLTQYAIPSAYGPLPPEPGSQDKNEQRSYRAALKELSRALNEAHPI